MSQVVSETEMSLSDDDVQAVDRLGKIHSRLCDELSRVIVGQRETVDQLLVCLFARRHALLMGVPGLAKTLLGQQACRDAVAQVQPHSVHARLDADGHHGHGHSSRQR
jgi:MoxR-like ATPase